MRSIIDFGFLAPKRSFMIRAQIARGAELGDLFEKVVVQIPEERQPLRELIDTDPPLDRLIDVADAVGNRERQFLHRGRSRPLRMW